MQYYDYVFVETLKEVPNFVGEDLKGYGPYPSGFNAIMPIKAAWILAKAGFCKPSGRNGAIMFHKEKK